MAWCKKLLTWIKEHIFLEWINNNILLINVFIMSLVMSAGYVPFVYTFVEHDTDTLRRQPACQSKCSVSIPHSSVDKFNSLSLESIQLLFVHFSGYNLSLGPSINTDILDPLNLVWTKTNEAPLMYLDLGFNVYSFMTLSRTVHHMNIKVEVEPINCLQNISNSCVTANLARAFLSTVTKKRGVLCYTVNDENRVNYRCCKGNVDTQQVECDITAVPSPETTAIFIAIAIAALIVFLCFPALFDIVPEKENSYTLSSNIQVHNPLYLLVINAVQTLRRYSAEYYFVNVLRKLFIVLTLPTLYYIDVALQWYTATYDTPEMFNDAVKEVWLASKVSNTHRSMFPFLGFSEPLKIFLFYYIFVITLSILPYYKLSDSILETGPLSLTLDNSKKIIENFLEREKDFKINWLEPCNLTKDLFCWLKSLIRKAMASERSCCSRSVSFLGFVLLILLSPVVVIFIFISYTGYVSPLGKVIRRIVYHAVLYVIRCFKECSRFISRVVFVSFFIAFVFFPVGFGPIFYRSLLLSARMIVYLWMGLVASKDYYFPLIAYGTVFVYYSWNCFSSVKSKYHILLKQTFKKCKDYQEKHPDGRKALTFDDKRVPRISSELFQDVIDQILPRSEVYTIMILKLTAVILFLVLTFSSILLYGKSNLNESTKVLALFLTALLPKLLEVFGEGSSYQKLCKAENSFRVEEIVKDYLSRSHDANPDDDTSQNHNAEQLPCNQTGDQSSTARTTSEGNRRGLDFEMAVNAHVNTIEQNMDC